ncbi:hypothetical protein D9M72_582010 [compost metagenome]
MGTPVEPDVKKMRATSTLRMAARAALTVARRCGFIAPSASERQSTWPGPAPFTTMVAASGRPSACSASAKGADACTKTAAGSTSSWMPSSRVNSWLCSE